MTDIVAVREITDAIVALLEGESLAVGRGKTPDGVGWQGDPGASSYVPFVNVHPLSGGVTDGTITDPDDDADTLYQLTCVGSTQEQAEWIGDQARNAMLQRGALTVPSRTINNVRVDMLGGARQDDSVEPVVFMTIDHFRVLSVPN